MAKVVLVVVFLLMYTSDIRALSVTDLLLSAISDKMDSFDQSLENINYRLDRLENVIGMNGQVLDIGDNLEKQEIGKGKDTYSEMLKTSNVIKKAMSNEKRLIRSIIKEYGESFNELKNDVSSIIAGMNHSMQESYENMEIKVAQLDTELNDHIDEQVTNISIKLDSIENDGKTERQNMLSKLEVTQDLVTDIETNQNAQKNKINALESQLTASNNAQKNKFSALESKLTASNNQRNSEVSSLSRRISSLDNQRNSEVSSLSRRISSLDSSTDSRISSVWERFGKRAGFNAELTSTKKYSKYSTIIFDNDFYNPDSAYSSSTGQFTAPHSGTYLFSISVEGTHNKEAYAVLKVDGWTKMSALSDKGEDVTGSRTCVTYMNKGAKALVQSLGDCEFFGARTAFTGVFLY